MRPKRWRRLAHKRLSQRWTRLLTSQPTRAPSSWTSRQWKHWPTRAAAWFPHWPRRWARKRRICGWGQPQCCEPWALKQPLPSMLLPRPFLTRTAGCAGMRLKHWGKSDRRPHRPWMSCCKPQCTRTATRAAVRWQRWERQALRRAARSAAWSRSPQKIATCSHVGRPRGRSIK